MTSTRTTARIVGLLFLTQTIAFIIAEQVLTAVLKRPDYLTGIGADANVLAIGALPADSRRGQQPRGCITTQCSPISSAWLRSSV